MADTQDCGSIPDKSIEEAIQEVTPPASVIAIQNGEKGLF
jgi:hypothetical protein